MTRWPALFRHQEREKGRQGQRRRRPGVEDAREQGGAGAAADTRSLRRRQPDRDQLAPHRRRCHRREREGRGPQAPRRQARSVRQGCEVRRLRPPRRLRTARCARPAGEGPAPARLPQRQVAGTAPRRHRRQLETCEKPAKPKRSRPISRSSSPTTRDKDQVDLLAKKIGRKRREGERHRALRVRHRAIAHRPVRRPRRQGLRQRRTRRRRRPTPSGKFKGKGGRRTEVEAASTTTTSTASST